MGTHVFFEKNELIPVDELYCKCDSYYQFRAKTNKVLRMSRVLLKEKETEHENVQEKDVTEIKNQLLVQRTYQQALDLFLAPGRKPPRKIPDELNCEHLLTVPIAEESPQENENNSIQK